jgi:hypothetical protein
VREGGSERGREYIYIYICVTERGSICERE